MAIYDYFVFINSDYIIKLIIIVQHKEHDD